jgi:hypothetical protein
MPSLEQEVDVMDRSDNQSAKKAIRLVERDVVQIEFLIDDLVKQLEIDRISPVANCGGCNSCSATFDVPVRRGERGEE